MINMYLHTHRQEKKSERMNIKLFTLSLYDRDYALWILDYECVFLLFGNFNLKYK